MKIAIVGPLGSAAHTGNKATASRWRALLIALGHKVQLSPTDASAPECDVLIALHAGHSAKVVKDFSVRFPDRPVVLAAAGTDLYKDIHTSSKAKESLRLATRIVLLQPRAQDEIPKKYHKKCHVIFQSAKSFSNRPAPLKRFFEVCVIGHLRPVKDPFRAAMAVRNLPDHSKIKVIHLGAALTEATKAFAIKENAMNPRYEWLGQISHPKAMSRLLRSRLLVHSSKTEGGANVVTEAIVGGVPVLSSEIPGSIGLLGDDYPGYFETGNTAQLRTLLLRAESDRDFLESLRDAVSQREHLFTPSRERDSWQQLLSELDNETTDKQLPNKETPNPHKAVSDHKGKPLAVGARHVKTALKEYIDPEKAAFYPRFFKAGKGEYAEGDKFIGVTVPNQRRVAKRFRELPIAEVRKLLNDPIHEHRLTGLLVLVQHYQRASNDERREELLQFYLDNLDRVNNWDLVDASAHKILGDWLLTRDRAVLYELAESNHLWRERVSVIACLPLIKNDDFEDIQRLTEHFLEHPHDLIHKAVGWMLREMGKQNEMALVRILKRFYRKMPRTMLRYAIEKLPEPKRRAYIEGQV